MLGGGRPLKSAVRPLGRTRCEPPFSSGALSWREGQSVLSLSSLQAKQALEVRNGGIRFRPRRCQRPEEGARAVRPRARQEVNAGRRGRGTGIPRALSAERASNSRLAWLPSLQAELKRFTTQFGPLGVSTAYVSRPGTARNSSPGLPLRHFSRKLRVSKSSSDWG